MRRLLVFLFGLILLASPALAEKRLAFIAGIDQYESLDPDQQLQKAVNDARAVGTALEGLGFEVFRHENLGRLDFTRAWSRFLSEVDPGDIVAVFYAGHGIALDGVNFLVPRDVPKVGDGEKEVLAAASLRVSTLTEALRDRHPRISLIILDACRDNPFADSKGRSMGGSRGLARIEPARGTFMMFSADEGQRALDRLSNADSDPNSVYTRKLVPMLKTPGLGLRDIAVKVRQEVNALARTVGDDQFPAYYDAMQSELFLAGEGGGEAKVSAVAEPAAVPAAAEQAPAQDTDVGQQVAAVPAPCSGTLVRVGGQDECVEPGASFRDCENCPEMVVLPEGRFSMGSTEAEEGREKDESPLHDVAIADAFAIGRREVTRGEFAAFLKASGYKPAATCMTWTGSAYRKADGRNWRSPGFKQADSHPVVCVSWEDAEAYADWLSRETGAAYRLPSESEWEYAARAGTGTRYFWGNDARGGDACAYANGAGQELSKRLKGQPLLPCRDRYQYTAPAGSLKASPFGLFDAIGNAAEWTEDCYHDSYAGAPADGSAWAGDNCRLRVFRGGGWGDGPSYLRSALRSYIDPDVGVDGVGFRLARTLTQ